MSELSSPPTPYGSRSRGVSGSDIERAADHLLRAGERPTVEKIRAALGTGSPNTINPLLNAWWKRLAARLDAGPASLHRLPEPVARVAEALWMQALEEGRRGAMIELRGEKRAADQAKDAFEVRSHVLTLREGELDARLGDQERRNSALDLELKTLLGLLRREQATRERQAQRIAELEGQLAEQKKRLSTLITRAVVQHRKRKQAASQLKPRANTKRGTRNPVKKRRQSLRTRRTKR